MAAVATVAVLGPGSWGTALALLLARNGHRVRLWGHDPDEMAPLCRERENRRYLPGIPFPPALTVGVDLTEALAGVDLALAVVPSHAYGITLTRLRPHLPAGAGFAWATKGLEHGGGRFLHEVTAEILGAAWPAAVISGPSFAREVARGLPTAVTVASGDAAHARRVAALLHGSNLRAYTSADVIGVELGGAVKNVLAIAAGIADGLGFGANARAALITRGLAEMARLAVAVGARPSTLTGLSGLGDLVLTCSALQSRNFSLGVALGHGTRLADVLKGRQGVTEGVFTAAAVVELAERHRVSMPIAGAVDAVLNRGADLDATIASLLARPFRDEDAHPEPAGRGVP